MLLVVSGEENPEDSENQSPLTGVLFGLQPCGGGRREAEQHDTLQRTWRSREMATKEKGLVPV